jgi:hypothetical protein
LFSPTINPDSPTGEDFQNINEVNAYIRRIQLNLPPNPPIQPNPPNPPNPPNQPAPPPVGHTLHRSGIFIPKEPRGARITPSPNKPFSETSETENPLKDSSKNNTNSREREDNKNKKIPRGARRT